MSIPEILTKNKKIAVVGASRDPAKPSNWIPKYLQQHGYKIFPVNPSTKEWEGQACYASLGEIPEEIDVVDVFRPSGEAPGIVKAAIEKGAKVVWLQEGIESQEAAELAKKAGIEIVMDRCIYKEHKKLDMPC